MKTRQKIDELLNRALPTNDHYEAILKVLADKIDDLQEQIDNPL